MKLTMYRTVFGLLYDGNRAMKQFVEKVIPGSLVEGSKMKVEEGVNWDKKHRRWTAQTPTLKSIERMFPWDFAHKKDTLVDCNMRWHTYRLQREIIGQIDWKNVMKALDKPAATPKLIWTPGTKKTLLDSLVLEIEEFDDQKKLLPESKWEWDGFEVLYPELLEEYAVGNYFLRLLMTDLETKGGPKHPLHKKEVRGLMDHLFIKATVELKREEKLALVKTMALVYKQHADEFKFMTQVPFLVALLQQTKDEVLKYLVVSMLKLVLSEPTNVRSFIDSNGIQTLVTNMIAIHSTGREEKRSTGRGRERKQKPRDDFFGKVASGLSEHTLSVEELAVESLNLMRAIFKAKEQYQKVVPRRYPMLVIHLTQMMFANNPAMVKESQNLLLTLVKKNSRLIPTIAKTGIFIFGLYELKRCSNEILEILYMCHQRQKAPYAELDMSVLEYYLPGPFVERIKEAKSPEEFRELLVGKSDSPSYIWTETQEKELAKALEHYVLPLQRKLKSDPSYEFDFDPEKHNKRVEYKSLANELCVGNTYPRLLLLGDTKELKVSKPNKLATALVQYMPVMLKRLKDTDCDRVSREHCEYLLRAQYVIMKKYAPESMQHYKAFAELMEIMRMTTAGEKVQDNAGNLVIQLLKAQGRRLSKFTTTGEEKINPNVKKCIEAGGSEKLGMHFVALVEKGNTPELLLLDSLEALTIMCTHATPQMIQVACKPNYKLLSCLAKLMDPANADKKTDLCFQLLNPLVESNDRQVPMALVESGLILRLIQVAVEVKSEEKDRLPRSVLSSVAIIKKLVMERGNLPEEEKARRPVRTVVRDLLTGGMYQMLLFSVDGIDKVAHALRKDTETPTVIWTAPMRKELHHFIAKEEKTMTSYVKWRFDEDFQYSALRNEPVWENVYLRIYSKQNDKYELPDYIKISKDEFYHSLLSAVRRFGLEKGLLFETASDGPSGSSKLGHLPIAEGSNKYEHMAVLVGCIDHILRSDKKLLEKKERGLIDLISLVIHPHPRLQDEVLSIVEMCSGSPNSMQYVIQNAKWILCMIFNSAATTNENIPTLKRVLSAIQVMIESGAAPSSMGKVPGALTFKEVEGLLLRHGLPVLLANIIAQEKKYTKVERIQAAKLCGMISSDGVSDSYRILRILLTWQVGNKLPKATTDPLGLVEFFDTVHCDPQIFWTKEVRQDVISGIVGEAKQVMSWQENALASARRSGKEHQPCTWDYKNLESRISHPRLDKELCVGEIFVYQLVNFPHFRVDPEVFLPPLWVELQTRTKAIEEKSSPKQEKVLVSLLEALKLVLTNLPFVGEDIESKKVSFLYKFLRYDQEEIKEKALEVVVTCAKETAIKAAMEGLIRMAMPLLAGPENEKVKLNVLKLLSELVRRSSPVVKQIIELGGHAILVLICMGQLKRSTKNVQTQACKLIGAMVNDGNEGIAASDEFCNILTQSFKNKFMQTDTVLLAHFHEDHEYKGRVWNRSNRNKVIDILQDQVQRMVREMPGWKLGQKLFDDEKLYEVWPRAAEEVAPMRPAGGEGGGGGEGEPAAA
uniref:DnaJ homologue subfamily C GRV2/DNAJC13 N-terminal domain-containing protein n=1 Tax=Amorphochlora amoebiformis TaxID=1561963 RepID=A0A7S0CRK4_9EUKA